MTSEDSHDSQQSDEKTIEEDIGEEGVLLPKGIKTVKELADQLSEVTHKPTAARVIELGNALFESKHYFTGLKFLISVARFKDELDVLIAVADLLLTYTTRYDIAIIVLKRVIELAPYLGLCRIYLARAYFLSGDIVAGSRVFDKILRQFPHDREAACENIGSCLLELGYFKEAYHVLTIWLEIGGGETPNLAGNMACALARLNRLKEAQKWYKRALELCPGNESLEVGYGLNFFKMGLFKEGFPFYARRTPRVMRKNGWFVKLPRLRDLKDVKDRKVCLYHEQGLGDTLQFIRFLPRLLAKGAQVTLFVPHVLKRLFALSFPEVSFGSMAMTAREAPKFDYSLPIADLPFVCGLERFSDIPANLPCFRADEKDVERFAHYLPNKRPRIGLVWSGQDRFDPSESLTDRRRSIAFKLFIEALTPIDAQLVNLQYGMRQVDLTEWKGQEIVNPMTEVSDMADTAAIIENLDLLISVDTSVVHLAGGLDHCPIWLISRWDACWRWGEKGETTPWYPEVKIFRPQQLSFAPIMKEIGTQLPQWVRDFKEKVKN